MRRWLAREHVVAPGSTLCASRTRRKESGFGPSGSRTLAQVFRDSRLVQGGRRPPFLGGPLITARAMKLRLHGPVRQPANLGASTSANVAAIPNQTRTITVLLTNFDLTIRGRRRMTLRSAWKRALGSPMLKAFSRRLRHRRTDAAIGSSGRNHREHRAFCPRRRTLTWLTNSIRHRPTNMQIRRKNARPPTRRRTTN